MSTVRTHKDLIVWQKSVALASTVYTVTRQFPTGERRALAPQMRGCALSVASNIAEGAARGSRADYIRFLNIARGSLSELETQVLIGQNLGLIDRKAQLEEKVAEVGRLLSALHRRLNEHRDRSKAFPPPVSSA